MTFRHFILKEQLGEINMTLLFIQAQLIDSSSTYHKKTSLASYFYKGCSVQFSLFVTQPQKESKCPSKFALHS